MTLLWRVDTLFKVPHTYTQGIIMSNQDDDGLVREHDRLLPIANVSRIMKQAVPSNAKIAKDAKETVQKCVSEFISFVTSEYPFPLYISLLHGRCC